MDISQQRIAEAMLLAQFEPEELARLTQQDIYELAMIDDSLEWNIMQEDDEDDSAISADWYKEFLISHLDPSASVDDGEWQIRKTKQGYSNGN